MLLGRDFINALDNLSEKRGLDTGVIISALEAALSSAYSKFHPGDIKLQQSLYRASMQ